MESIYFQICIAADDNVGSKTNDIVSKQPTTTTFAGDVNSILFVIISIAKILTVRYIGLMR